MPQMLRSSWRREDSPADGVEALRRCRRRPRHQLALVNNFARGVTGAGSPTGRAGPRPGRSPRRLNWVFVEPTQHTLAEEVRTAPARCLPYQATTTSRFLRARGRQRFSTVPLMIRSVFAAFHIAAASFGGVYCSRPETK